METKCFNVVENKNGNTTLNFLANGKNRYIVFHNGSQAQIHFHQILWSKCIDTYHEDLHRYLTINLNEQSWSEATDSHFRNVVNYMRKLYRFTVNPNNPQYFYAECKLSNAAKTAA